MSAAARLLALCTLPAFLAWADPAATPPLAKASPFLPPNPPGLPRDPLELDGTSAAAGRTLICVYDARVKASYWIAIGDVQGGIAAVSFDAATQSAVVMIKGVRRTLYLKDAPGQPGERDGDKIKRQQAEARMLVSDLVDIGMQQRKASAKASTATPKP